MSIVIAAGHSHRRSPGVVRVGRSDRKAPGIASAGKHAGGEHGPDLDDVGERGGVFVEDWFHPGGVVGELTVAASDIVDEVFDGVFDEPRTNLVGGGGGSDCVQGLPRRVGLLHDPVTDSVTQPVWLVWS